MIYGDFYSKYGPSMIWTTIAVLKYLLLVKEKDNLNQSWIWRGLENRLVEKSFKAEV